MLYLGYAKLKIVVGLMGIDKLIFKRIIFVVKLDNLYK